MKPRQRKAKKEATAKRTNMRALIGSVPGNGVVVGFLLILLLPLVLLYLFSGPEYASRRGTTMRVDHLLLTYPLGLVLLVAIGGALLPKARKRWTAVCAGVIAIAPLCFAIALSLDRGYESWTVMHTATASIMSIVFGAAVASGWHGDELNPTSPKRAG